MSNNTYKVKSVKINMVLNVIKTTLGIIVPLITFPYASRILGVESIGKYSFAKSVISYFALFAALGVRMYTISYGAKYRDDPVQIKKFSDSVFTINMIFTVVAYIALALSIVFIPKFQNYTILLLIMSSQILLTTIGVDWLNTLYEDYLYITIRTIIFNVIYVVLLLALVKSEQDLIIYTTVYIFGTYGANLLNAFYARRYCKVGLTRHIEWKRHMKPLLMLFATQAMITIYVSSDTTILGFMCDDSTVGIYHVSSSLYQIIKSVISAIIAVSIPRLANLYGQGKKQEFSLVAQDTYHTVLTLCLPALVGLILLRDEIIDLVAGSEYAQAADSVAILSVAMFFCLGAYFWGQAILVPVEKEGILFRVTIASALVNVVLNLLLIPFWKEKAAALTTLIAEALTFFICRGYGKKYVQTEDKSRIGIKSIVGCFGIALIYIVLNYLEVSGYLYLMLMIILSVVIYFVIEYILKNTIVRDTTSIIIKKITRHS